MSVELYLSLLLISVIFTILLTEALKRLLNSVGAPYRTNAVVLDSAMICSTLVGIIFKTYLNLGLSLSPTQIIRLLLVILSTWFVSMVVYDKMVQTKKQYKKFKKMKGEEERVKKLCIQAFSEHGSVGEGGGSQSGQDDGTDSGCGNRNDSNDGGC